MQMLNNMVQEIAQGGLLLKLVLQEVWLIAAVVAGFEYFGVGPGGFLACAHVVVLLVVLKRAVEVGDWVLYYLQAGQCLRQL